MVIYIASINVVDPTMSCYYYFTICSHFLHIEQLCIVIGNIYCVLPTLQYIINVLFYAIDF